MRRYMPGYDDNEIGPTPMKTLGPKRKPDFKAGTGKAAEDGYTVLERRSPWGGPGDMIPVEEAEAYEKAMGGMPYADDY